VYSQRRAHVLLPSSHTLANEARQEWHAWNKFIKSSTAAELPAGITPKSKLLDVCGAYWITSGSQLSDVHKDTLTGLEEQSPEWREKHFVKVIVWREFFTVSM
jgi:hypothetical protein